MHSTRTGGPPPRFDINFALCWLIDKISLCQGVVSIGVVLVANITAACPQLQYKSHFWVILGICSMIYRVTSCMLTWNVKEMFKIKCSCKNDQVYFLEVNNYEIVINLFISAVWYSKIVHKSTRIYPICSTYELTKQFM